MEHHLFFGFLLGLTMGSFINVCIDRLPLRFANDRDREKALKAPELADILKKHIRNGTLAPWRPARSFCFACGDLLNWRELIPVFSFLKTGGRCRKCGAGYGARSLLVELSHGVWYAGVLTAFSGSWFIGLFCINFSFLWILGYCHACPVLGKILKMSFVMLMIINGLTMVFMTR